MIELIEHEIKKAVKYPYTISHHTSPKTLMKITAAGHVTPQAAGELIKLYTNCIEPEKNIILNVCSSVGDVAESAKQLFEIAGIPIVRIDEEMCRQAVLKHKRIGIMATLRTTLEPSVRLLEKCAQEEGKNVEIVRILADGLFDKPKREFEEVLCGLAGQYKQDVDALVLAQASMTFSEKMIQEAIGKPVYSSPRFGALAVAKMVQNTND
jgi:Asp/Glu/hydantoin racemase